jgi:hypothetical protein
MDFTPKNFTALYDPLRVLTWSGIRENVVVRMRWALADTGSYTNYYKMGADGEWCIDNNLMQALFERLEEAEANGVVPHDSELARLLHATAHDAAPAAFVPACGHWAPLMVLSRDVQFGTAAATVPLFVAPAAPGIASLMGPGCDPTARLWCLDCAYSLFASAIELGHIANADRCFYSVRPTFGWFGCRRAVAADEKIRIYESPNSQLAGFKKTPAARCLIVWQKPPKASDVLLQEVYDLYPHVCRYKHVWFDLSFA